MIIISEIMHLIVIQMILIANPAKPFKVTPKQTLKRADILKEYSHEISEAYRAFELSSSSMDIISPPSSGMSQIASGSSTLRSLASSGTICMTMMISSRTA